MNLQLLMNAELPLCESPIDTFQGEYPCLGAPVRIVRFAGCNLKKECPIPCDTIHSWSKENSIKYSIENVLKDLEPWRHLMITGGEPFIHPESLSKLLTAYLSLREGVVVIETNGTLIHNVSNNRFSLGTTKYWVGFPQDEVDRIFLSISPKADQSFLFLSEGIPFTDVKISVKMVIGTGFPFPRWNPFIQFWDKHSLPLYLMPEGVTKEEMLFNLPQIYQYANNLSLHNFMISPRTHILMGVK
jgi:hypothetical protein